jgi:CHRD domain
MPVRRGRPTPLTILAIVAASALAAPPLGSGLAGASERAPRSVQGKTTLLKAELGPAAVVPGPGDPDGTAADKVSARPGELKLCVRMEYELGVGRVTEIHIHEAGVGEAGPAIATLYEEGLEEHPGPR